MAFWESVAKGTFQGLISGVGSLFKDVRTAITGEEPITGEQKVELLRMLDVAEARIHELEAMAQRGQIDLNIEDAKSGSLFKGGWRPALGWVCVFALGYTYIGRPLGTWAINMLWMFTEMLGEFIPLPALDTTEVMTLIFALLGLGATRAAERIKGVHSK